MTEADNSVAVVCVPMFNGAWILELVLTLTIQYPAPSPLFGDSFVSRFFVLSVRLYFAFVRAAFTTCGNAPMRAT